MDPKMAKTARKSVSQELNFVNIVILVDLSKLFVRHLGIIECGQDKKSK